MGKYIVAVGVVAKKPFDSLDEAKRFAEALIEEGHDARIDWLIAETSGPTPAVTYRRDPQTGDWDKTAGVFSIKPMKLMA